MTSCSVIITAGSKPSVRLVLSPDPSPEDDAGAPLTASYFLQLVSTIPAVNFGDLKLLPSLIPLFSIKSFLCECCLHGWGSLHWSLSEGHALEGHTACLLLSTDPCLAQLVRESMLGAAAACSSAPPKPRISGTACSACLGFTSLPGRYAG